MSARAAWLAVAALALPGAAAAQSAPDTPGYFMPPSAVLQTNPVPDRSPVVDDHLTNVVEEPPLAPEAAAVPWYETDWGVAALGVAVTGLTFTLDHGINQFANTKISPGQRATALQTANKLELAPLAFALATTVQSPLVDARLAHASSIAVTAAAEVTAEAFVLKYAIGRGRPATADSSPFSYYPFNASKSTFSLGAVFPGEGAQTSSFPSGHTLLAFALVTPYAELYHQPLLYAIPVAVGLGRIASPDGHWASDVVGGGFLGWLTADLTRRYFPDSDYGLMIFGDGQQMMVGVNGRF